VFNCRQIADKNREALMSSQQRFDVATDIIQLSASEIAQHIRDKKISAREVVEEHIKRIEVVNPQLNTVVLPRFEQALLEAEDADASLAAGKLLGPLHGVPITIKDQFMVEGLPTTWGLPSKITNIAAEDGPLVKRLRQAGAIVLGKTNVPELLFYHESDNPLFGRSNNPWNLERTPGGSSGGEGSIIAAYGSPLGLGGDIGGSIRIPAHFCGIHGLKPTTGRLTNLDSPFDLFPFGLELIQAQPGPLARSVADLALAMKILAAPGLDQLDPSIAPVPWQPVASPDISLANLRIAMYTDDTFFPAAPAIQRSVQEAAMALRARGAVVEEWTPPGISHAMQIYLTALSADGGVFMKRVLGNNPVDFRIKGFLQLSTLPNSLRPALAFLAHLLGQHTFTFLLEHVRTTSTAEYMRLTTARTRYRIRFLEALNKGGFDAIICPPDALPALTHGNSFLLDIAGSYSLLYNLLGMPAGVVAATRVQPGEEISHRPVLDIVKRAAYRVEKKSAGLPVGVQVASRYWREDVVLTIMTALEEHFRAQKSYPLFPVTEIQDE
jgi:fatty acid amide hydrolase